MSKPIDATAPRPEGRAHVQTVFVHRIRVGWADCDPALIAYTGRIPYFALEAIDAWWERHVGADWYRLNLDQNIGTPFVHLDLDFRSPVTPRALLECHVHLKKLGKSSVTFRVEGRQNGAICFGGTFISAFVEANSFRKIPIPEHIRAEIEPAISSF